MCDVAVLQHRSSTMSPPCKAASVSMSPTACDTGQTDDVGFQQQQQRNLCLADEV